MTRDVSLAARRLTTEIQLCGPTHLFSFHAQGLAAPLLFTPSTI